MLHWGILLRNNVANALTTHGCAQLSGTTKSRAWFVCWKQCHHNPAHDPRVLIHQWQLLQHDVLTGKDNYDCFVGDPGRRAVL